MRTSEIKALNTGDLGKELEEAHREYFNLRFRHATRQLANYSEIWKVKKKIARLKTVQRERELIEK
ncbi:MAG: 50S ribosomal protein L29 [Dehalococcoidia bacterium]|nr:50S ribosomal protein L29 [Dehalococcoidia bacterium]